MVRYIIRNPALSGPSVSTGQHDSLDPLSMGGNTILYPFERIGRHIDIRWCCL